MKHIYFTTERSDFAAYNQAATFGGLSLLLMKTETDESSNVAFLLSEESSKSEYEGIYISQPCAVRRFMHVPFSLGG